MPGRPQIFPPKPAESARGPAGYDTEAIDTDVIVCGAGIVGLTLGIALARAGAQAFVVGRIAPRMPGRTVALLDGSIQLLQGLGIWSHVAEWSAPLRTMRLVDDTGSLFRVPPVAFRAEEIDRPWFGCNIENWHLVDGLVRVARDLPGLHLIEEHVRSFAYGPSEALAELDDGRRIQAKLLVAADGRRSPARHAAGLAVRTWRYPQVALTAILRHEHGHDGISTEFHGRQGPFTLVPLPGVPQAPHRSSLVWVMSPCEARRRSALGAFEIARAVERQSRMLLGRIDIEGDIGSFPIEGMSSERMAGQRIALAGEAAHAFPPIGAQGLNLGLRDVAELAAMLASARRRGLDPGSPAVLDCYHRARRGDVALRTMMVDGLNRALLTDLVPVDLLRGAGLLALGSFGPLRRLAMRQGLMPGGLGADRAHEA